MKTGLLLLMSPPKETVEFGIKNGFSAIEISFENMVDSFDRNSLLSLSKSCTSENISLSVHAPSCDLNIASFNEGIRKESIRQLKKTISMCADLVTHVTIHANYYPGFRRFGDLERIVDGLSNIAVFAEELGVILSIENVHENSIDQLLDYMLLIDSSHLKLTIDIAHLVAYGGINTKHTVKVLSKYINNIHLSDNDGHNDLHLPLGDGSIYFDEFLAQLNEIKYNKALIIEAKSMNDALKSKKYLEEKLYKFD